MRYLLDDDPILITGAGGGVGGAFLIVPTLAIFLALSMRLAVGTSLAVITSTSVMGLAAHLLAGRSLDLVSRQR